MIKSKYSAALKALSKKAVFSSAEGREAGIPSRMVAYFCEKGQLEQISKGMYKINNVDFDSEFEWEDLTLTALSIPNGFICLISALCYYGLTDEIMREFWIAIPHATTSPAKANAHIVRCGTSLSDRPLLKSTTRSSKFSTVNGQSWTLSAI